MNSNKKNAKKENRLVTEKYIEYISPEVYAIVYRSQNIIYYNLNFNGDVKMIIYRP